MAVDPEPATPLTTPLRVRVIGIPPDLPIDDLDTPGLFAKCVGKSFEVIGKNGELLELAVGEVLGVAASMHSIWIEPEYTDANFTSLRLSGKMLLFMIDAVEYRIAAFDAEIADPRSDENTVADAGNDRMLLLSLLAYVREQAALAEGVISET
jgi:hypothetical protein